MQKFAHCTLKRQTQSKIPVQQTMPVAPTNTIRFKENEEAPTSQIIQTKGKFNDMYGDMTKKLADMEETLLAHQEKNSCLAEQERVIRERFEAQIKSNSKTKDVSETSLFALKNKLNQAVKAREDITEKYTRLVDQMSAAMRENERLKRIVLEREVEDKIETELFAKEVDRLKSEVAAKEAIAAELRKSKEENEAILANDPKLSELRQRSQQLIDSLIAKEKELSDVAYACMEAEALQKLALQQREFEAEERRKLSDEVTRLRVIYEETERNNALKFQRKMRDTVFVDLNIAEDQIAKSQLELKDLQTKFTAAHQFHTRYSIEVAHLSARKQKNTEEQTRIGISIKQLEAQCQIEESLLSSKEASLKAAQSTHQQLESRTADLQAQLSQKEETLAGLKARLKFLSEKFDFEGLMNQIDIGHLKQVIHSNNSVNQTIEGVLQNWEAMRSIGQQK